MPAKIKLKTATPFYIIAGILIMILGSLNHFIYEWSHQIMAVRFFAAMDESVFSHLKLVVWPWFLCFIVWILLDKFSKKRITLNYFSGVMGLLMYFAVILTGFYFYTEALSIDHILVVDIILYIVAVIACMLVWWGFSRYSISKVLDLFLVSIFTLAIIIWVLSCSFLDNCANIYQIPS